MVGWNKDNDEYVQDLMNGKLTIESMVRRLFVH